MYDSDDELLARFRKGDKKGFTELVIRYQKPLYNAAYRILRSADDAADITQLVFLKVVESLDEYDPQYKFFSWIYRIAVNESLNWQRRNGRSEPIEDGFDMAGSADDSPESRLGQVQFNRQIEAAMMSLAVNDRVVLSLRHFSECSYDDMAEILQIDQKTVKSRLFEARRRLSLLLKNLRVN